MADDYSQLSPLLQQILAGQGPQPMEPWRQALFGIAQGLAAPQKGTYGKLAPQVGAGIAGGIDAYTAAKKLNVDRAEELALKQFQIQQQLHKAGLDTRALDLTQRGQDVASADRQAATRERTAHDTAQENYWTGQLKQQGLHQTNEENIAAQNAASRATELELKQAQIKVDPNSPYPMPMEHARELFPVYPTDSDFVRHHKMQVWHGLTSGRYSHKEVDELLGKEKAADLKREEQRTRAEEKDKDRALRRELKSQGGGTVNLAGQPTSQPSVPTPAPTPTDLLTMPDDAAAAAAARAAGLFK